MEERIICSGFGGQGVLSLGQIISILALNKDKNVTWIPAYGAEMRGGTANCSVVFSDELVGSPLINDRITVLVAMNQPSVDKFIDKVVPNGLVLVNSSVVTKEIERKDLNVVYVNATEIATQIGSLKYQNMVMLGAFVKSKDIFDINDVKAAFDEKFGGEKAKFIPGNMKAVEEGMK